VVSENYYPGWRATISGQDAPVVRTNYNLIGVPLPVGAREVRLHFTDPAYEAGKMITILALLASIAAIIGGIVLQRRRAIVAT
jgi:uncharacterized membrane protein YfhO